MDAKLMLELYDRHERLGADYPNYRREEAGPVLRMMNLEGEGNNFIIHSRLTEADADRVIAGELAHFGKLGRSFEWKLYSHDLPSDLKARLAAQGFSIGEDEAIMALDLAELPAELAAEHPHDVRKVADETGLADFEAINAKLWPDDAASWMAQIVATLRQESERMSVYVAYVDGIPVSAARIDFPPHSPFASVWGGATLEPYRKRGVYTALLSVRAKEAIARGYRYLTIDASPMSRPIVTRHGFKLLAISNPCDFHAIVDS